MTCKTVWHLDDRIILTQLSGDIDIHSVVENDEQILNMIQESSSHTIHLIIDVRDLNKFPTQAAPILRSASRYLRLDNMGWVVIVGFNNPLVKFLSHLITQLTSISMAKSDTVEEATQKLFSLDPLLSAHDDDSAEEQANQ